jgi:hypothetical protein
MGVPAVTQAFLIGVAVLRDDCGEAIRMANCEAEADGCAIVEDVDREAIEAAHLGGKSLDSIQFAGSKGRERRSYLNQNR